MIVVRRPEKKIEGDVATLSAVIEVDGERRALWFKVPASYAEFLTTERSDCFLTAILMLAMSKNQDIQVEGLVSEKLFVNLQYYYTHLLNILDPSLSKIRIHCERDPGSAITTGTATLMGFSGGVDSFAGFYDHFANRESDNYKLTHLVYNRVHWPGSTALKRHSAKMSAFAADSGLPIIDIESNIHEFVPATFVFSYIIRNTSAILALQKMVRRFLIASSYKYEDVVVEKTYSMGFSESITAPLLSTDNVDVIISGAQYSRTDKTALLCKMPSTQKYLDVCTDTDRENFYKSCSKCGKCLRTQITLEILGNLADYNDIFDSTVYRKFRIGYVSKVLRQVDEYDAEIFELAREHKFEFSAFEQIRSARLIHEMGRRIKRVLARP